MMRIRAGIIAAVALATLGACAPRGEPILMHAAQAHRGPDEFAILPTRPLQPPPDYNSLPQPTPGGRNLVDPDPRSDAYAALGGRAQSPGAGVPAADGALLAHAGRHGVEPGIREQLAAEDLNFRQRNRGRVLERLFGVNAYHRTYARAQGLNQQTELERWREGGRRTPTAPPPETR